MDPTAGPEGWRRVFIATPPLAANCDGGLDSRLCFEENNGGKWPNRICIPYVKSVHSTTQWNKTITQPMTPAVWPRWTELLGREFAPWWPIRRSEPAPCGPSGGLNLPHQEVRTRPIRRSEPAPGGPSGGLNPPPGGRSGGLNPPPGGPSGGLNPALVAHQEAPEYRLLVGSP
ncbi:unnamed protein product [Gadus morhua 'NCC']